jgi:hypothetical protein
MNTVFFTVASKDSLPATRLMIDSLRTFGGEVAEVPFWVFATDLEIVHRYEDNRTLALPLSIPDLISAYPFGDKVAACARAEEIAAPGTRSLVWIDPHCLIVQPPVLFELDEGCEAAFRPVHIRNVGLPPSEPLDAFWRGIYAACDVQNIPSTVTSFVDGQRLRPYFNTHGFAINPALGMMGRWYELFQRLVGDKQFQAAACADELHQIFLFQALLSTLLAKSLDPKQIRLLPSTYNYPYNLQDRIPAERQLSSLNETICFTYEERSIHPKAITGIKVHEPLRAWLEARTAIS